MMGEAQQSQAQLHHLLQADEAVKAVAILGSVAQSRADRWSDLDLLIVVEDTAFDRFFPALAWLEPCGELFAYEQASSPFVGITRVCFADFRRLDCVITTEGSLARLAEWPDGPHWEGAQLLFARSDTLARRLAGSAAPLNPPAFSAAAFVELQRDFWFKGVVAITKVVRGDPLIALHLALDMLRDCCVLAMVLRDRATGTTIHRDSPLGREAVQHIVPLGRSFASGDILSLVEQAAITFDDLAGRWSSGYAARRGPLLRAIAHARQE